MATVVVDIDGLCPWDLQLRINGRLHKTVSPKWADVIALSQAERIVGGKDLSNEQKAGMDATLRDAVKRFMPADSHADVDAASWDTLLAAFAACSEYFSVYIAKKKAMAAEAVSPPAAAPAAKATPPLPRGKPSSPSPS